MIFGHTVKNSPQRKWVSDPTKSFMYRCTNFLCLPLEAALLIRCEFFVQLRASRVQPKHKTQFILVQNDLRQWFKQSLNNTVPISPDL